MKIPSEIKIFTRAFTTTKGKLPLKDVTFIIPVRIESHDRLKNFQTVYSYLLQNFDTNIIVYECDSSKQLTDDDINTNHTTYIYDNSDTDIFHRTKYLNRMLNLVTTPVTVNYDIDVILPVKSYVTARNEIIDNKFDLVFPYTLGKYQKKVNSDGRVQIYYNHLPESLSDKYFTESFAEYGHCQFFNTESYKKHGWENENFISYGPEDRERYERFKKFDCQILYLEKSYVYHLEHSRGKNSNKDNPHFKYNENLREELNNMTKKELTEYYQSVDYLKNYTL